MPSSSAKKSPKSEKNEPSKMVCSFCKKEFVRELAFLEHMCEKKRRWGEQGTKHVVAGFRTYQRFYKSNNPRAREKTFEEFIHNRFYTDFVKFGRHLLDINAINPDAFIDFLIKNQIRLSQWQSPVVYETYVRELNKKESPDAAIERSFMLMLQWANETGEPWTDFFRKISPVLAVQWIQSGRISPWVIFTASSAEEMISRFSEEQTVLVYKYIDPRFWEVRMRRAKDDVEKIKSELDSAGL